jgi:tetratricopeptide (TPR) repeat protein
MLVEEDKRLAHARAADRLAGHAGDAVAIAEHHERAQAPERAAPWWAKAATQALEANDFTGAIARAEAAERCGARGAVLVEALTARVEAHACLNENHRMREAIDRLGAEAASSPSRELSSLRWAALGALRAGDTPRLSRTLERARELIERDPDSDMAVFCPLRIAVYALNAGLLAQADALAAVAEAGAASLVQPSARVLGAKAMWRGVRAHHDHDAEASARLHREAAELFEASGDVRAAIAARGDLGYVLVLLGAHEEAVVELEASLAESCRIGLTHGMASTRQNLGIALLGLGRVDEALVMERAAVEDFAAGGNRMMECGSRDYASRILLSLGRIDEALAEAERALMLLPAEHPIAVTNRATLADALLVRRGPDDLALALSHACSARQALRSEPAHFEEPAFIVRVHLDALEANGLVEEAQRARAEACAWIEERASRIQSAHYRRAYFERALDIARILRA